MMLTMIDHREALPRTPEVGLARADEEAGAPVRQRSLRRDAVHRFTRNRGAVLAVVVFALIVLYCLVVPVVSPHDPNEVAFSQAYLHASLDHPFGTDKFGRDLFTRVAVGGGGLLRHRLSPAPAPPPPPR